jgi:hypothetical protein
MKHKHYDCIVAWAEGKTIQFKKFESKDFAGTWTDIRYPSWDSRNEYRIKPESTCPRCGKVHDCEPVDPDKIAKEHAKEIADAVDADVLKKLYDLATAGMRKQYYEREADYCREEIDAFNHDPSEYNRERVLSKRREFNRRGNDV